MALSRNFGVNHALGVTGLESLVRHAEPSASAQCRRFLELAKNGTFLDRKRISALYDSADGHQAIILPDPAGEINGALNLVQSTISGLNAVPQQKTKPFQDVEAQRAVAGHQLPQSSPLHDEYVRRPLTDSRRHHDVRLVEQCRPATQHPALAERFDDDISLAAPHRHRAFQVHQTIGYDEQMFAEIALLKKNAAGLAGPDLANSSDFLDVGFVETLEKFTCCQVVFDVLRIHTAAPSIEDDAAGAVFVSRS